MSSTNPSRTTAPTTDQLTLLTHWRELALTRMPYMASILYGLRAVSAPGLGTFGVDHHMRLYVDFDAVAAKGDTWCMEGLLHECGHVFGQHYGRSLDWSVPMDTRSRRDFNIAGDCSINDDLIVAGLHLTPQDPVPAHLNEPEHLTVEHYYDVIRAKRAQQQQAACSQCGQPQSGEGEQSQSDQSGQSGEPQQNDDGQPGQCPGCGQGKPTYTGCGSASGGQPAPCELDEGDDLNGQAPAMGAVEQELMQVATAHAVLDAAAKSRGSVPGGMAEQAGAILRPSHTPWQTILAKAVRRATRAAPGRTKRTYARVNRRRQHVRLHGRKVVYPGTFTPRPNIAVVRDTSGSMSTHALGVASREVDAISRRVGARGPDLRVLDVDTQVHSARPFTGTDSIRTAHGRGGTDMVAGIKAALDLQPRPDAVVVITDMCTPWPVEPTPVPVIACAVEADEGMVANVPDWITTVIVDDLA